MRRFRNPFLGAAAVGLSILLSACQPGGNGNEKGADAEPKGTITVGVSAAFAENQIVAEMYAQVLEKAGYKVERQLDLKTREVSQPALESGEIDLKPEYLGTLLSFLDKDSTPTSDPDGNVEPLKELLGTKGLVLLDFSDANDTNAFVVTKATADKHGLKKVSDLQPVAKDLTLGGPPECEIRPFCIPGLKNTYGIEFGRVEKIGACDKATAEALDAAKIDVALLCSTQSIIASKGWIVLEDDKQLQKADNIVPVIRKSVLTDEVEGLLNKVSAKLTTENITALNAKVELENEDPEDVAKEFLQKEGLL